MKWLVVGDPALPLESFGDVLAEAPAAEDVRDCPAGWRAVYLEATVEQVRRLQAEHDQICRVRPVWERSPLSPAELLIMQRRLQTSSEGEEKQ